MELHSLAVNTFQITFLHFTKISHKQGETWMRWITCNGDVRGARNAKLCAIYIFLMLTGDFEAPLLRLRLIKLITNAWISRNGYLTFPSTPNEDVFFESQDKWSQAHLVTFNTFIWRFYNVHYYRSLTNGINFVSKKAWYSKIMFRRNLASVSSTRETSHTRHWFENGLLSIQLKLFKLELLLLRPGCPLLITN